MYFACVDVVKFPRRPDKAHARMNATVAMPVRFVIMDH